MGSEVRAFKDVECAAFSKFAKSQAGLRGMDTDALHLAAALALHQSVSLRFDTFDVRLEQVGKGLMSGGGGVSTTNAGDC